MNMIKNYQSEEICAEDIKTVEEFHELMRNFGKLITKMINKGISNNSDLKLVELEWMRLLSKNTNPRGLKGFWDLTIVPKSIDPSSEGVITSPEIVTMNKRIENRQVVVWE